MTEVLDSVSLKALSLDTRQEIMKMLAKRPYTSSEISKILNKHVTTITEHLSVLESSGLVRRKESANKWVYYVLTEKGEKLFKPKFYSWVVVLSLSFIVLIAGVLQIFSFSYYAAARAPEMVSSGAQEAAKTYAPAVAPIISTEIFLGIILIGLSMLGFGYLIGKASKRIF